MSVARVVRWMLLGSLPLACGERAGEAVVALPAAEEPGRGGQGGEPGAEGGVSAAAGGGTGDEPGSGGKAGPGGLCAPCATSKECGDANDACILHDGERFCGRDCDEQSDCPDGYACLELSNSQLWQCVPDSSCPSVEESPPSLTDVRSYVLSRINSERFAESQAPLQSSSCLDELAQQSALDFAHTDEPLGKFVKECDPVWPNCACGWWAEAEVTIARFDLDWQTAVNRALTTSREDGNTRFANAYLSAAVSDVGIGFWLSGDEAWVALSFR
ncbi:MAG: hypothetical protein EOO73_34285 [Myxococcales bacterium]|nr:MAG: hypothetical protein EOO73_34285 [Myxococcales bacterium]